MSSADVVLDKSPDRCLPRQSLAIAQIEPGRVAQSGDASFESELDRHYAPAESLALERALQLRRRARKLRGEQFWNHLAENLAKIAGAQVCFISKRVFEGEDGTQTPLIGEPGSCLTAVAWYLNDGKGTLVTANNLQYYAFSCPCGYMKHDKVLLIPGELEKFTPVADNPNGSNLPFPLEAYLALPLFSGEKCVAHFGFCWSKEGAQNRQLGWGFLEMLCQSFEDMIASKLIENEPGVLSKSHSLRLLRGQISGQSLKPYARTLSHELRTPMHGVVGMLDLMYANVEDTIEQLDGSVAKDIFLSFKDDLELVQDSSRRAVEAADNIVQAYDLDLGLPNMHRTLSTSNEGASPVVFEDGLANKLPLLRGHKRRLSDTDFEITSPIAAKSVFTAASAIERRKDLDQAMTETKELCKTSNEASDAEETVRNVSSNLLSSVGLGLQYSNVRDLIEYVVDEALKVDRRPEAATVHNTDTGQTIEVTRRAFDGSLQNLTVEWVVEWDVPEIVLVEERDLAKLVSCVLQNALKFTEQGKVLLRASVTHKSKELTIAVSDTGPGIPTSFRSKIFNPFTREDYSLTRRREGLGLGLMVAKGLARKLGGDLILARTETEGPEQGSNFQIFIPVSPTGDQTALGSPFSPRHLARHKQRSSTPESASKQDQTPSYASSHSDTALHSNVALQTSSLATSSSDLRVPLSVASSLVSSTMYTPPVSPTPQTLKQSTSDTDIISPPPPPSLPAVMPKESSNGLLEPNPDAPLERPRKSSIQRAKIDQSGINHLAATYPLTFLVVEDNMVNRKLLVNMLAKLGYDKKTQIYEAHDGTDAVNKVRETGAVDGGKGGATARRNPIDVILMDLWMPIMDGYTATERILEMFKRLPATGARSKVPQRSISAPDSVLTTAMLEDSSAPTSATRESSVEVEAMPVRAPTIMAVTADATGNAAEKAARVGMEGFMVKPFKIKDLEKLVKDGWLKRTAPVVEQEHMLEPAPRGVAV